MKLLEQLRHTGRLGAECSAELSLCLECDFNHDSQLFITHMVEHFER